MIKKSVLLTAGPIPAALDSVKYLTNRFKGGLALKTAQALKDAGFDVTVCMFKHAELLEQAKACFKVIEIEDVVDYYNKVLAFNADAYVLAAAVANLMPSNPWKGKFPSHQYQVGEKFEITFEIAPRVIDAIKVMRPRSCLIGYKLFDGSDEELIQAGTHTLTQSKANVVFANNPSWAKDRKIALTQDGSKMCLDFQAHIELMIKAINAQYYRTQLESDAPGLPDLYKKVFAQRPSHIEGARDYGCLAIRAEEGGFWTSTRGKSGKGICYVREVSHDPASPTVRANQKASLNAPLIERVFALNPGFKVFLHGHGLDPAAKTNALAYEFPGSLGDLNNACQCEQAGQVIQMPHHGWWVGFNSIEDFLESDYAQRTQ